jgi:hypothetical protein
MGHGGDIRDNVDGFERFLKADCPSDRLAWGKIEETLRERLRTASLQPSWEHALKISEEPSPGRWEKIEDGLVRRIAAEQECASWEQAIKGEHVPSPGCWESIEQGLDARIERHQKLDALSHQPVWISLGFYLNRGPAKSMVAGLVLALVFLAGAFRVYQERFRPLETVIYQAQGPSTGDLDSMLRAGRTVVLPGQPAVEAEVDGSVVMVNKRGFVDIRNGSSLEIRKASRKQVHYRVDFDGQVKRAGGNVTFFVNPAGSGEEFLVSTPDYRIEVLGTYFRVDPGLDGRVTTAVLEGKVRIRGGEFGDYTVGAGETFEYNPATGRYRVLGGGLSVPRDQIETVPGVEELQDFGVVSLTSDVPRAEVRIDGQYRGLTPLVVLLPPGIHSLRLSRGGHAALDTLVSVREGAASRLSAILPPLQKEPAGPVAKVAPKAPVVKSRQARRIPEPVAAAPTPKDGGVARLFHRADVAQASDWRAAILLYAKVLEHPEATAMRKEAALFSIARLRADHEVEKSRAQDDFLRYLTLYPKGAFAAESWMRLAEMKVGRDPDKAIEYYLRCIAESPRHHRLSELQHRLGLIYLQTRRYDEAIAMFSRSLGNVLYNSEGERRKIYGSLYRAYVAKGDSRNASLIDERYRPSADSSRER